MAPEIAQDPATALGDDDRKSVDRVAVGFARQLRMAGLAVPLSRTVTYARALALVGLSERDPVYWAGRATLLGRSEHIAIYDRVFSAYWQGASLANVVMNREPMVLAIDDTEGAGVDSIEDVPESQHESSVVRYSALESLRERDFATYSEEDWTQAYRLIAALTATDEFRRSRRAHSAKHRHGNLDVRRTIRLAMRTEGDVFVRARKRPTVRPRPVVLLVDVSGSMETYARALLCFSHAVTWSNQSRKVEVFAIGTRLTRVTLELNARDPDAALSAAAAAVPDWSGGTRLGDGIEHFNDKWGTRGPARGAIVVILSDGWDRGDPAVMGAAMQRLSRVAHRIVWVNPLKAHEGFAPLAQGMAAALPWIDDFVAGHSIDALEHLADVIANSSGTKSAKKTRQTLLAS